MNSIENLTDFSIGNLTFKNSDPNEKSLLVNDMKNLRGYHIGNVFMSSNGKIDSFTLYAKYNSAVLRENVNQFVIETNNRITN